MNHVKLILKNELPKSGQLFYCPKNLDVYILIGITHETEGTFWTAKNIGNDFGWNGLHKSPEEAIKGLIPLGPCEVTIKQISE